MFSNHLNAQQWSSLEQESPTVGNGRIGQKEAIHEFIGRCRLIIGSCWTTNMQQVGKSFYIFMLQWLAVPGGRALKEF